jgi:hypothetical protein
LESVYGQTPVRKQRSEGAVEERFLGMGSMAAQVLGKVRSTEELYQELEGGHIGHLAGFVIIMFACSCI